VTKHLQALTVVVLLAVPFGALGRAQEKPASQPAAKPSAITPLRVQVIVSKYQGEKRTSSHPYTLTVHTDGTKANLRMGAEVPILSTAFTPLAVADGKTEGKPISSYSYRSIGTTIDCTARPIDDGRFRLDITLQESSVYTDDPKPQGGAIASDRPVIRSYSSTNTVILKDGQSAQYTSATDRISGEVIRVDVTLNVVK